MALCVCSNVMKAASNGDCPACHDIASGGQLVSVDIRAAVAKTRRGACSKIAGFFQRWAERLPECLRRRASMLHPLISAVDIGFRQAVVKRAGK
jgi:hypothetical protein